MKHVTTALKQRKPKNALRTSIWFATCEDEHPYWQGLNESTFDLAQGDADTHDKTVHNDGRSHASVLPGD